jgi:minor extracellular serine protease Vpr
MLVTVVAASTALATATLAGPAGAATARPSFSRLTGIHNAAKIKPLALSKAGQVTVSVTLSTPSVLRRETRLHRSFKQPKRQAIRRQVHRSQNGVRAVVASHHGTVLRSLADAVNAVTVRVPRSALPALAAAPGVTRVVPTHIVHVANTASDLFTGVAQAWEGAGRTGTGMKIADIDTGIDYYHSDFGGSGNPADFAKDDGLTIEPGTFPTAKVVGGFDFVGDAYDPDSADPALNTPKPDPDPLDCNGHGSHTAGTAAGFGVTAAGTYHGPYTEDALHNAAFTIGPGTAPNASILAYRVFGCDGSAGDDVIAAAIDRAVADGANVINMSLGATYGGDDSLDSIASDAAAQSGVIVVAAAGNEGSSAYVAGEPGSASRVLDVAAVDSSFAQFPAATIDTTPAVTGLIANGVALDPAITAPVVVVPGGAPGTIGLGCDAADYAGASGAIVVTTRGVCDRVARAQLGQAAGAVAVIMVNNGPGLPPFEGPIPGVTIPFIGVSADDTAALAAAGGQTHTLSTAPPIANPTFGAVADFSSSGPRNDSSLKPDVAAPGVSVISVGVGTGSGAATDSGTSMATPHTAGIAALVREAHPTWSVAAIKAAIMDTATADPSKVQDYDPLRFGAGLVQPGKAVDTQVVAVTTDGLDNLSFGYRPQGGGITQTRTVTLLNNGSAARTYDLAAGFTSDTLGSALSFSPSHVRVPAGGQARVNVTIRLSRADVAALPNATDSDGGALISTRGVVTATPTSSGAGIYSLRIPFLLVPRGLSDIAPESNRVNVNKKGNGEIRLRNNGIHDGTADFYALGATDPRDAPGPTDLRAVGVQVLPTEALGVPADANDRALIFAVNTYERWSNPGETVFEVSVDTNKDGAPDFFIDGEDAGLVTAGVPDGTFAAFIFDAAGNLVDAWNTVAPMNSSTVLLPALASDLGLTADSGGFDYGVASASQVEVGTADEIADTGSFNAFDPAQSTGEFVDLGAGDRARVPVTGDRRSRWMVVTFDDANGGRQADIVRARRG